MTRNNKTPLTPTQKWRKLRRWELIVIIIIVLNALIGGGFLGYIISEVKNKTALKKLSAYQPKVPTRIYDANGRLISELFKKKRELVHYKELPKHLVQAFLAVEDANFFEHFGIDFEGILRAAIKNIKAGRIVEGGSTMTQQLVKGLFTEGEKTFSRKIVEAVYALQVEKEFSKKEILEMYFNQIYFGHGAYGIKSAVRFYFDKDVKDLSLVESAILAALPKAPHTFSPIRSTHRSYERNRVVLNLMVKNGFISQETADQAYKEFWPPYIRSIQHRSPMENAFGQKIDKAPYFTDHIRQILIARYGEKKVYNDGLKVYTSLNLDHQKKAQQHLWSHLERFDETSKRSNRYASSVVPLGLIGKYSQLRSFIPLPSLKIKKTKKGIFKRHIDKALVDSMDMGFLFTGGGKASYAVDGYRKQSANFHSNLQVQGALVSVEPKTGYVTAMVGGTPFSSDNQFNRALKARRQPGSAFKPFVYTAAIDSRRYSTGSVELDAPLTHVDESGGTWTPENYGQENRGPIVLKKALALSLNIISVRIYDRIGPDRIIDIASRMMKIPRSRFNPTPSLALGGSEVTPMELATGFAVFANEGKEVIPLPIRFVNNRDGRQISNTEYEVRRILAMKEKHGTRRILPKPLNWIMVDLMRFVVRRGTATRVRTKGGLTRPVAGKTGTTSNWADGWFAGYTPRLSTVIWTGYDERSFSLGPAGSGGNAVAPIFGSYMSDVLGDEKPIRFSRKPRGVKQGGFCTICNGWPTKHCPKGKRTGGYFLEGFSAPGCPQEEWKHYEYSSINERYQKLHGLSDKEIRKRLMQKMLKEKDKKKDKKKQKNDDS